MTENGNICVKVGQHCTSTSQTCSNFAKSSRRFADSWTFRTGRNLKFYKKFAKSLVETTCARESV